MTFTYGLRYFIMLPLQFFYLPYAYSVLVDFPYIPPCFMTKISKRFSRSFQGSEEECFEIKKKKKSLGHTFQIALVFLMLLIVSERGPIFVKNYSVHLFSVKVHSTSHQHSGICPKNSEYIITMFISFCKIAQLKSQKDKKKLIVIKYRYNNFGRCQITNSLF